MDGALKMAVLQKIILAQFRGKLPPRPWRVYHAPLRPQLSKSKIIEIQDRDGKAVIPWGGFDNSDVKNRLAIAKFIVGIVNRDWAQGGS